MNKLPAISTPVQDPVNPTGECKKTVKGGAAPDAHREEKRTSGYRARQSGKLHSRFAGYMAFGAAVFVSLMAAATVASHDVPLMLGGF